MGSFAEKLAKKRKELADRSSGKGGKLIFMKEGTYRVRILNPGKDKDFILEVPYFYPSKDMGGFISPSAFGLPCPWKEKYDELNGKGASQSDKEMAKKMGLKKKPVAPVILYKDDRGKEIDEEKSGRLILLTNGLHQQIIDHFLDPEWGDFTDPDEGYDFKITRTGKGQFDTEYSLSPCKNTKISDKKFRKQVDLEEIVKANLESYDELETKLAEFMASASPEDDDSHSEERPKKSSKFKKKKATSDLEDDE